MYKLLYYSDFKDIAENSIRIEIYKDSDLNVSPKEITLSNDAAQIECDADNLFTPIKITELTVNVLTKDILHDLYTSKANEITCKVLKNGELFWFGYLSPNIYSSEYIDETNLLSLEFVDTLSQLEYFKYEYIAKDENKSYIRSFYDIIASILDRIDCERVINDIYISNSIQVLGSNDLLSRLMIQERNFFDEANEADTCKNVLSEIVKYLSMTMIQYENKYFIVDYESIKSGNNKFVKYNRTSNINEITTLSISTININNNIFNSSAQISLDSTYNKISLVANNNPLNNLIPELFDKEDLINVNSDINKYYTCEIEDKTFLYAFFNSKMKWNIPLSKKAGYLTDIPELTDETINSVQYGVFIQKNFSYKTTEEPSNTNFDTFLTFVNNDVDWNKNYGVCPCYVKLNKGNDVIFQGGSFIIDLNFMLKHLYNIPNNYLADSALTSINGDSKFEGDAIKFGQSGTVVQGNDMQFREYGYRDTRFPCKLKIGNYYYDGEQWQLYTNITSNQSYYDKKLEKRLSLDGVKYYADNIEVSEEEYTKIYLKDRFFLVHKNVNGEQIKDTWKRLTNQVSYKYNLVDGSDGVLINLPDFILNGQIEFELYAPLDMGDVFPRMDKVVLYNNVTACHIKELTFKYTNKKYYTDIFSEKEFDADILYSNEINESFVNDFDDLELRVNSFSDRAGSYSYVITQHNNTYQYVDSVYNVNTHEQIKQEENILTKYFNYYSSPKYIYSNTIKNDNIKPYNLLFENTLNKTFFLNKWVMNLSTNSVDISVCEI